MCKTNIYQRDNPEENKVLRAVSPEVSQKDISSPEIQSIIHKMISFIEIQPDGAALAAPQIGENVRIFIVNPRIANKNNEKNFDVLANCVYINPEIIKNSKKKELLEEGCFSVRHWYGKVNRFRNITIEAYDGYGNKKQKGAGGLLSQIFQHEIEHLDGVLFSDKAFALEKMSQHDIDILSQQQKALEKQKTGK